jgi:hypothetical protein
MWPSECAATVLKDEHLRKRSKSAAFIDGGLLETLMDGKIWKRGDGGWCTFRDMIPPTQSILEWNIHVLLVA